MAPFLENNGLLGRPTRALAVSILLLYGLTLVAGDRDECSDGMHLMFRAEMCLTVLEEPYNSTLVGALTREAWQKSCVLYNQTIKCIEDVFSNCPQQAAELDAGAMISGLHSGLGLFCENDETFELYLGHSDCYARQEPGTVKCMNKFLTAILHLETARSEDIEETIKHMCRSLNNLISCVNTIIGANCGEDASSLFERLVRAQVPSQVTSLCDIPEENDEEQEGQYRVGGAHTPGTHAVLLTMFGAAVVTVFAGAM